MPDPAAFAGLAPELAPLAGIGMRVGVEATLDLNLPDRIRGASLKLTGGAGRVVHPAIPGGALDISAATGRLRWDAAQAKVVLEDLFVDLGGPTLAVTGRAEGIGTDILARLRTGRPEIRVAMEMAVVDMPTATLWRLWPAALVPGGRRWVVANIADGGVRDAQIRFAATLPPEGEPRVERLDGIFSYQGLTVTYMPGLPPVRQVGGQARFDDQQLTLDWPGRAAAPDPGRAQHRPGDRLPEARPADPDRDRHRRPGARGAGGDRPAAARLPGAVRPAARGRVGRFHRAHVLRLPGDRFPEDGRCPAAGDGGVRNGSMPTGVNDWRLTDADLNFEVDKDKLEASGTGRLLDVPIKVTGREVFAANAPIPSEYTARGGSTMPPGAASAMTIRRG